MFPAWSESEEGESSLSRCCWRSPFRQALLPFSVTLWDRQSSAELPQGRDVSWEGGLEAPASSWPGWDSSALQASGRAWGKRLMLGDGRAPQLHRPPLCEHPRCARHCEGLHWDTGTGFWSRAGASWPCGTCESLPSLGLKFFMVRGGPGGAEPLDTVGPHLKSTVGSWKLPLEVKRHLTKPICPPAN